MASTPHRSASIPSLITDIGAMLRARGWRLVTAESCTGGGIARALTDLPGSSAWFDRGFVTYSNASKQELLGVTADTLAQHGAVSAETVAAMAAGALDRTPAARIALAVSGIAGPDGGTPDQPVGTVWCAWAWRGPEDRPRIATACFHWPGDRATVRNQAARAALAGLLERLETAWTPHDAPARLCDNSDRT